MKVLKCILAALPAVLCMLLIFSFSAEPAVKSSQTSGGTIRILLESFYSKFDSLSSSEQLELIENLQFLARKSAHFTIYAALGFFVSTALLPYSIKTGSKFIVAAVISALYAVSDEIHQYFVPGRACQLRDVLIDCAGITAGIAVYCVFLLIIGNIRKKLAK